MKVKKTIFRINPQSHVRSTKGDSWVFRIPRHKLRPASLARLKQLEKYNNYKLALSALAKENKFVMDSIGTSIKFFFPVTPSWPKHKKERLHRQWHLQRPDIDNCIKAFLDSLHKEDCHIAHIEAFKYWVNEPEGYIEITQTFKDVMIE